MSKAPKEVDSRRRGLAQNLRPKNLDKILLSLVSILLVLTLLVTSITSQITKRKPQ